LLSLAFASLWMMNFKTATFRAALAERGMTVRRLAKGAKVNPRQLLHVLNEHRKGRHTWRRIEDAIFARERALLVELYGPVFGEEPVNEEIEV
jgi:lambda repressor-like predicted transcriptional regulator